MDKYRDDYIEYINYRLIEFGVSDSDNPSAAMIDCINDTLNDYQDDYIKSIAPLLIKTIDYINSDNNDFNTYAKKVDSHFENVKNKWADYETLLSTIYTKLK